MSVSTYIGLTAQHLKILDIELIDQVAFEGFNNAVFEVEPEKLELAPVVVAEQVIHVLVCVAV